MNHVVPYDQNLGPEIIRRGGVLREFPALDDFSVAEDESDCGRHIQGFSVALGVGLLESYGVVFSANDVQDSGLKGTLGTRSKLTEIGHNGISPLLRPRQHAASGRVPNCVLRE